MNPLFTYGVIKSKSHWIEMPEWEVRVLSSPGWPKEPLNDCKCWEFAVCLLGRNKVCLSASWQAEPSEVPNVHRAEVEPWIGTGGPALAFLIDLLGNLGLFGGWESQWVVCMDSSLYDLCCCCVFCLSVKVSVQEWSTYTNKQSCRFRRSVLQGWCV